MALRHSGKERNPRDYYPTPEWVTELLIPFLPRISGRVWEPAAGNGIMSRVLARHFDVVASDIEPDAPFADDGPMIHRHDFLDGVADSPFADVENIITNPPYTANVAFVERALVLTRKKRGVVAMLMRDDFDYAGGRRHLFAECPAFTAKIVIQKRIVWFPHPDGKKKENPSEHHAWMIWDWRNESLPVTRYASKESVAA